VGGLGNVVHDNFFRLLELGGERRVNNNAMRVACSWDGSSSSSSELNFILLSVVGGDGSRGGVGYVSDVCGAIHVIIAYGESSQRRWCGRSEHHRQREGASFKVWRLVIGINTSSH
jgi:hypothetical protein